MELCSGCFNGGSHFCKSVNVCDVGSSISYGSFYLRTVVPDELVQSRHGVCFVDVDEVECEGGVV